MPPEPSSVSPHATVAMLKRGDAVTISALDAHRVFRVLDNVPVDGLRELRLRGDGERTIRMRGGDQVVRHDHLFEACEEVGAIDRPAPGVVLEPPPDAHPVGHPYAGTIRYQGLLIYVENPIGSTRSGVDKDGKPWSVTMTAHYGEIANTVGADGDPIDAFVGPDPDADTVYVIQTKIPGTSTFDEVKCMIGFPSRKAAVAAFYAHYTRPGFMAGITAWPIDEFHRVTCHPLDSRGKLERAQSATG